MADTVRRRPQVIHGGLVLDSEGYLGPRDILVIDGLIVAIGPHGMAAPDDAETVAADRFLIHPGFVNSHTHGHGNIGRSMGDRWNLEQLVAAADSMYGGMIAEEKKISAMIGASEMALKGCTAAYDLFVEVPGPTEEGIVAVASAYDEVGMRVALAPLLSDRSMLDAIPGMRETMPEDLRDGGEEVVPWKTSLDRTRNILKNWRYDRDRIRPAVAPTIPMYCSDEFMIATRDLAAEFDVGMSSHVSESKVEAIAGEKMYGRSIVAHLAKLGLLTEKFTAAHAVWLDPDDMKLMADAGASMAHNPASNMRLGNGIADVAGTLAAGVNIGIGTDGATCSDNLNMYIAVQLAAICSRAVGPDPAQWLSAEQVFRAATLGGAKALGFERIGRIAPGYAADLVFLDLDSPTLMPMHQPLNQVVLAEDGTGVESVMVGGRFVVRGHKLLTVDLAALSKRATALRIKINERQKVERARFERVSAVLADFCPSMSLAAKLPINRFCGCGKHALAFEATGGDA
jgi:5-methylthioadenosine/S-adenosylhomocysteine deaminase